MAHFIPEECDVSNTPYSEQIVFEKLQEHLSHEWVVFHSLNYVKYDAKGYLWDGEIDFLLYHEQTGFLVIEVKGGDISYRDGHWYQNNEPMDPFEQARGNKFAVMNLLRDKHKAEIPLKFAHAVCFPSCDETATTWPPEAQGLVITGNQLENIEHIAFRLINEASKPDYIGGHIDRDEVLDILSPEFEYQQHFLERMRDDTPRFKLLTEQQNFVLDALQNFPRLLFQGGAGTGKTVLAIKKARRTASNGGQVLLLCFNEMLAKKIRKEVGDYTHSITVAAFFEFCVTQMQIPQDEYDRYRSREELYTTVLPDLLRKYLNKHPLKFDTIIVDEAQDFTQQMWALLPLMLAPSGHFYVFYDPDQNIFNDTLSLPDFGLPVIALTKNCRNTKRIFEALAPYRTVKMELLDHTPEGCKVTIRPNSGPDILAEELTHLRNAEQIQPADICILGGHSLTHTSLGESGMAGEYHIMEQPKNLGKNSIAYYTYMKFKGCEAKVVILLDVDENDPRWSKAGLYTAMSRAMHKLIILKRAENQQ